MLRALSALVFGFVCCGTAVAAESAIVVTPEQQKALGVTTAPLAQLAGSGSQRLPAQVLIPPRRIEVIGAPAAGMISALRVAYGETARAGETLAEFRSPQLLELQRDYQSAEAQNQLGQESLRRDEALFADGIISQSRLSATRTQARVASAALTEKKQALDLAGISPEQMKKQGIGGSAKLRAPFDGVVLDVRVQLGQRVEAGTPLFQFGRFGGKDPLWLEIQASPAQAAGLASGDAVRVRGCKEAGKLTLIAPHLNASSQAQLLRAELPAGDGCVKPFQYVEAEVVPAVRRLPDDQWQVPTRALLLHEGKRWLLVEDKNGFHPQEVMLVAAGEPASLVAVKLPGETRIALTGLAALKGIWLGMGSGKAD